MWWYVEPDKKWHKSHVGRMTAAGYLFSVEELEELRPNEENRKRSVKTSDQSASSYSKTGRLTDIMDKVKPQVS